MAFKMKGAPYPMNGDTDPFAPTGKEKRQLRRCLLYTSDAADDS